MIGWWDLDMVVGVMCGLLIDTHCSIVGSLVFI